MAFKVKKNKVNFKGKMVSIGIDMHKISWRVTALVEGDKKWTSYLRSSGIFLFSFHDSSR